MLHVDLPEIPPRVKKAVPMGLSLINSTLWFTVLAKRTGSLYIPKILDWRGKYGSVVEEVSTDLSLLQEISIPGNVF